MTDDKPYRDSLSRLHKLVDDALQHDELPKELRREALPLDDEVRTRAAELLKFLISEDVEALRETALGRAPAGWLNRGEQAEPAEPLPELDEAREKVRRKRAKRDDAQ